MCALRLQYVDTSRGIKAPQAAGQKCPAGVRGVIPPERERVGAQAQESNRWLPMARRPAVPEPMRGSRWPAELEGSGMMEPVEEAEAAPDEAGYSDAHRGPSVLHQEPCGPAGGMQAGAESGASGGSGGVDESSDSEGEQEGPQKLIRKVSTSGQIRSKVSSGPL